MTQSRYSKSFWIRNRIETGGRRFIRDFFEGNEENLPTTQAAYQRIIEKEDKGKATRDRLYPPSAAILRFHESLVAFWWHLGFLVEVKVKERKWQITPEMDEMLRQIYSYPFGAKDRPKDLPGVKEYSVKCGFPPDVMTKRAMELGLSFTKEPPWTNAELSLLEEHGYKTPPRIALVFSEHGFKRTPTAIQLMRKRRMVHKASPYFSMNAIAVLFGIDAHAVKKWVTKGLLRFVMKGTVRSPDTHQNGDTHLIHKDWIYEFIVKHPGEFELKKVDQMWFLHIVTRGEIALSFSKKLGKRTEGQLIDEPVENRKTVARKLLAAEPKGRPKDMPPAERYEHGTRARYVAGCRCDSCRRANTDYAKKREKAKKKGDFNGNVPADHALNYIEMLADQGVGFKTIAKKAGVPHSTIAKIKSGERLIIRRSTETKIFSVTADAIAPSTNISVADTWKKINHLVELGFTKSELAYRLGRKTPNLQIQKNQITNKKAQEIDALYNQLLMELEAVKEINPDQPDEISLSMTANG